MTTFRHKAYEGTFLGLQLLIAIDTKVARLSSYDKITACEGRPSVDRF